MGSKEAMDYVSRMVLIVSNSTWLMRSESDGMVGGGTLEGLQDCAREASSPKHHKNIKRICHALHPPSFAWQEKELEVSTTQFILHYHTF